MDGTGQQSTRRRHRDGEPASEEWAHPGGGYAPAVPDPNPARPARRPRTHRAAAAAGVLSAALLVGALGAAALPAGPVRGPDRATGAARRVAAVGAARAAVPVLSRYRVRPGDTLAGVARLHDVPLAALAAANAHPAVLRPGMVLTVPDATAPASPLPDLGTADEVWDVVSAWASRTRLPAALLLAVTWRESSWRQEAVSDRGAVGVGQLLPSTTAWVSSHLAHRRLDPTQLEDNVEGAARYLRWLLGRARGDVAAALAAYHQGPASVAADGWHDATAAYVADVFRLRRSFAAAG